MFLISLELIRSGVIGSCAECGSVYEPRHR